MVLIHWLIDVAVRRINEKECIVTRKLKLRISNFSTNTFFLLNANVDVRRDNKQKIHVYNQYCMHI